MMHPERPAILGTAWLVIGFGSERTGVSWDLENSAECPPDCISSRRGRSVTGPTWGQNPV